MQINDEIFFSVIIPVYNRANYILKAVDSILQQSFTNWELIIVNDASTDKTKQILDQINHPRINIIHLEKNIERCASRNLGIENAKGRFIAFLDSDDYHLPYHLEELYHFIKSKNFEAALYFTNAFDESAQGEKTERLCPKFSDYNPYHYFLTYTVNPQRWAVHKEVFTKVKFDENVIICEDMDTSLRIVAAGFPCYQLEKRTTVYVAAPDSFTHGSPDKWKKELFYLKRIFKKPELKKLLPTKSKNRLISMCCFHLALEAERKRKILKFYYLALKSFLLCPKGYNLKTNKILLVNSLYNLPLAGNFVKQLVKLFKR